MTATRRSSRVAGRPVRVVARGPQHADHKTLPIASNSGVHSRMRECRMELVADTSLGLRIATGFSRGSLLDPRDRFHSVAKPATGKVPAAHGIRAVTVVIRATCRWKPVC